MSFVNIIHLHSVDSTNNYAAKLLKEGLASHGTVILADEQTAGRGQRGNSWYSEPGCNLLASFLFKPDKLAVIDQFRLSQMVSIALCDTLHSLGISACIKWPNDIYVREKKIAGLLIENQLSGNFIDYSIIGIGLNVRQMEFGELQATSVQKESGKVNLVRDIAVAIHQRLDTFSHLLHEPVVLQEQYLQKLLNVGIWAKYEMDGQIISARIIGVTKTGSLELETESLQRLVADLKEIKFIL